MVVKCNICRKEFTLKKNLYAHIRKIHEIMPVIDKNKHKNNVVCSLYSCICLSYSEFRDHFIRVHGYEMYNEEVTFQSKKDFILWKESKETKLRCSYLQVSGTQPSNNQQKTYYICHSSFVPEMYKSSAQEVRTKRKKSQGSAKLNYYACPSTMELFEVNQTFQAKLFLPHVGHDCALRHLNLTKMERAAIAGSQVSAQEAERMGLVSKIFPVDKLLEETIKLGEKIASNSQLITAIAKESVNVAFETTLEQGLHFEKRMFHGTFATKDQKEGMAAFSQKRVPNFSNE